MRALIYARVSSDPRGRGRSVDEQIAECKEWAGREGWDVVDIVRDNDRSATRYAKRSREGWATVKARLAGGDVDLVVTWAASRAQRDLDAYVQLRQLCTEHKVRWAYSGTVYDLADRQDRFRTGLDALVAEDEAERNREAVMRAMRSNAAKGRPHGRLPFGYQRVYDPVTRELVQQEPHPEEAPLVQEAARRFLAGESTRSIANDFNARGVPPPHSGRGWDLTRVRRLLTNPAMNGKRVHRGEIVGDGNWPPILDDETFGMLTARFADPSRTTNRQDPRARLLTGVARCGECGGPMTYAKQGGFGTRPVRLTYVCRYKFCVARDMLALDQYVTVTVLDHLREERGRLLDEDDPDVREAVEQAREWARMIDDATGEYVAKHISAATLGKIESELRAKIAEARRRVRYSGLPTIAAELAGSDDVEAEWDKYTVEQRRELVRALFEVVVLPVKVPGRRVFDPECVVIEPRR